jgi:alkanesulfonate monooxygenase SsuD/methylene tetrahydromethanopterin reductase-like flavin-dependent oxidoreductase (luciferase family)
MEFAIAYPARPDAWKDLVIAEDHGFTYAWFYDSQMLYSDVYACLALAAEHTKRIKLGTGVAIPSNRIEPVTAHSIATINLLAPGRTILGLGTGFTGRNTMGLPPVPLKVVREYLQQCRALLRGEEVPYRDGPRERWIKFIHPDRGYINLKDPIPLYLAANGPKALELTGELADGLITIFSDPEILRNNLAHVHRGAAKAGRTLLNFPSMALTTACVLHPGELATSQRVIDRVGPFAILALHALWESSTVAAEQSSPVLQALYERYQNEYVANLKTPADRRYLEVHEGHLIYLKPGEAAYLNEDLIRGTTLTGTGEELIARLKALEAAGLTQVAIQVITNGQEMIEEFSREVIAKY